MLAICDDTRTFIFYTWQYDGLKITHTVADGMKTMEFTYKYTVEPLYDESCMCSGHWMEDGEEEAGYFYYRMYSSNVPILPQMRILYDGQWYVIKQVSGDKETGFKVFAKLDLEELKSYHFEEITITNKNIGEALTSIMTDYYNVVSTPSAERWTIVGLVVTDPLYNRRRTFTLSRVTPYDCIEKLCASYMCEPVFDTVNRTIIFRKQVGSNKGVYFRKGLNLTSVDKKLDSMDIYTAIKPIGADGATLDPVQYPTGYITNFAYTSRLLSYVWEDENYTNMTLMEQDATAMLADMCKPVVSYSCSVRDLAAQYPETYDYLSYEAGDTIQIVDSDSETYDKQRIVKTIVYPLEPSKNSVEMANTMLTFEQLQKKLKEASDKVDKTISSDGKISYRKIRGLSNP